MLEAEGASNAKAFRKAPRWHIRKKQGVRPALVLRVARRVAGNDSGALAGTRACRELWTMERTSGLFFSFPFKNIYLFI